LGGVATGIATYLNVAPIVVQVAFLASTAIGGFGILAYIAGWFLIPKASDPETRPVTITSDTTRAVLGVLFAIAAASSSLTWGPGSVEITVIPLLLIAAGFYVLSQREPGALAWQPPPPEPSDTMSTAVEPSATSEPSTFTAPPPSPWATVDPAPYTPIEPDEPSPPVTAVTLAAAALGAGLLITIGQFGPSIPAIAVIGTALAIVGAGLIYGAFRGRARGLVPVGLLLALGLALAPAFDALADGGTGEREYVPTSEAEVENLYELGAGPLELDLRGVEFTEDRTVEVNVGAGYALIIVPDDVNVAVDASASAGYVELFGRETAGLYAEATADRSARPAAGNDGADAPTVVIDAEVTFGYVEVRHG
jgi:phage shock protein PspC (stress-responsive transcriptional regulator)